MISSLEQYSWSENENTIYSNLFIGGEADFTGTKGCKIITETDYPYDGLIRYKILPGGEAAKFTLAIRIPGWSDPQKTNLTLNGTVLALKDIIKDGFAYIERAYEAGDVIELRLDMSPYRIYSDTQVRHNEGCAAIQRGPLIYCFEGVDNEGDVHSLRLAKTAEISVSDTRTDLNNIRTLSISGYRMSSGPGLYSNIRPSAQPYKLTAIPYYTWGNRGLNQMRVWMPEE
jgi:DUF1680 family protein